MAVRSAAVRLTALFVFEVSIVEANVSVCQNVPECLPEHAARYAFLTEENEKKHTQIIKNRNCFGFTPEETTLGL